MAEETEPTQLLEGGLGWAGEAPGETQYGKDEQTETGGRYQGEGQTV